MRRLVNLLADALQARRAARAAGRAEKLSAVRAAIRARLEEERASEIEPPPVQTRQNRRKDFEDGEEYDRIELLGRGAKTEPDEWIRITQERRLVQSSNVFAYLYIPETERMGILYVTFLHWEPGMKPEERSGPGSTYAYYDFPLTKYGQFERMADESAGKAVWDYCRLRGSSWGHQHRYEMVQAEGDYVPRKATRAGFVARALLDPRQSLSDRKKLPAYRPNTLPGQGRFLYPGVKNTGQPNRGTPNRGAPNRGTPDRGEA